MPDTPDQNTAYALQTPEDSRALYARWAKTYDSDFAVQHDYVLPAAVAEAFAAAGRGPVLDIGAGTGLCGAALSALGVGPVDGTDISEDMLGQAAGKLVYRTLFAGNVLKRLDVPDGAYQGVVSSGTFTHGHVGPAGLTEVLRVLSPGGMAVLSVHAEHYAAQGFADALGALRWALSDVRETHVAIYGPKGSGTRAKDQAILLSLTKA